MKVISDNGDLRKALDWVEANSPDIPPEIVYPPKKDDHHHGHDEKPSVALPIVEEVHEKYKEDIIGELKAATQTAPKDVSQPEIWYRFGAILGGLLIVAMLLVTVASLPKFGSADAPAMNEVAKRYLESGLSETGAVNTVTGMILDYRAFDTLGESLILVSAVVTTMLVFGRGKVNLGGKDDE